MSEAKNTALGSWAAIGYSHVSPTKHTRRFQLTNTMITAALILTALTLLTITDDSSAHSTE